MTEQQHALALWLALIAGNDRTGLIEVRQKRAEGGMHRMHFRTTEHARKAAAEAIVGAGVRSDTYVGMAPRRHRHGGGKDAIDRVWALWADCDTPEAVHTLSAFQPAPSIIIKSGSVTDGVPHVHATWQLREPLAPDHAERALRRLAHALGADPKCAEVARILRPPGTLNFKSDPPRPVECIRCEPTAFTARDVVGKLPDPLAPNRQRVADLGPRRLDTNDPLQTIPAIEYVPALLGVELTRDGKVSCPWHGRDSNPSLHCYDGDGGWCCFGCEPRRGGDIISFGSYLYGIEPRGKGFHDIRRRLARDLLGSIEAAA